MLGDRFLTEKEIVKVRNDRGGTIVAENPGSNNNLRLEEGEKGEMYRYQAEKFGEDVKILEDEKEEEEETEVEEEEEVENWKVFDELPHLTEENEKDLQEIYESEIDFSANVTEEDLKNLKGIGSSKASDIISELKG